MKLDILAFAAHPDDIELSCGGTIYKSVQQGKKVGIVDLTGGELGTRGNIHTRAEEAADAAQILGLSARENLALADGFFDFSQENKLKIIEVIRKYQPTIVLANSVTDRHPDHARAAQLVSEACFLAGLSKIQTAINDVEQQAWRPKVVYHYIQDHWIEPDFIVDISEEINVKMDAVKAYKTQFYDPNSKEPKTPISGEEFFDFLKGRAAQFGRLIGTKYGEGFTTERPPAVKDFLDLG